MNFRKKQISLLSECIKDSIIGNEFQWNNFFKLWYRKNGTPYFFLFKKNLGVTNTQNLELFSLITLHSKNFLIDSNNSKVLFYTTEHIKTTFTEAVMNLTEDYEIGNINRIYSFSEKYIDIIGSSVAIDMFYGSCAVFIPGCIETNLELIVADSGYIHSAGKSIYVRNISKARKSNFFESLKSFIQNNQLRIDRKTPFIVYSHEDFSGYDKDHSELLTKGIDQCKLYVEKMSMGSFRLTKILQEIKVDSYLKSYLSIPEAGNYLEHQTFRCKETIWLISDRSTSGGQINNPGQQRYYVCYQQEYKNDSPFFYFDENKPAWKSHTTLPHSLTTALLNIARPFINNGSICDPFCGTGTTWFEIKRLGLNNPIYCSDLSPSAQLLAKDNLYFFQLPESSLSKLYNQVNSIVDFQENKGQYSIDFSNEELLDNSYQVSRKLLTELKKAQPEEDQEFELSTNFVTKLTNLPFNTRIVFYLLLRAELRFQGGIKRKAMTFDIALKKSINEILNQIKMLIELKNEISKEIINDSKLDNYIKVQGTYSIKLIPKLITDSKYIDDKCIENEIKSGIDARKLEPKSNDLIICDPPYGFNTTENEDELAELYSEFIEKAIKSLKPHGQLIMCLPFESYTGRSLPYCTKKDLVSRLIIIKAHQLKRVIYSPALSYPRAFHLPPYYWESDKALRRIMIHFHFI